MTNQVEPEPDITSLPEWLDYKRSPEPTTLAAFFQRCGGPTEVVLRALNAFALESGNWRVHQHAAQAFLDRRVATEAHYHSTKAVTLSGGHVMAHVALARALELRRFPGAVFHQLDQVKLRIPMLPRGTPQHDRIAGYLAAAFVRAYCYVGNVPDAKPWLEFAKRSRFTGVDTWMQLLHAAVRANDEGLAYLAAQRIGDANPSLSGRENGRVLRVLRQALLRAMRAKQ